VAPDFDLNAMVLSGYDLQTATKRFQNNYDDLSF